MPIGHRDTFASARVPDILNCSVFSQKGGRGEKLQASPLRASVVSRSENMFLTIFCLVAGHGEVRLWS